MFKVWYKTKKGELKYDFFQSIPFKKFKTFIVEDSAPIDSQISIHRFTNQDSVIVGQMESCCGYDRGPKREKKVSNLLDAENAKQERE